MSTNAHQPATGEYVQYHFVRNLICIVKLAYSSP
jgi:hypothetical protein